MATSTIEYLSTVCGFHVYMRTWTPVGGESLTAVREPGNVPNRNAVALFRGDTKVGRIPMKIS